MAAAWKPPAWCAVPLPEAPRKVLVLCAQDGTEHTFDISSKAYYILGRQSESLDVKLCSPSTSRTHAAVLNNAEGHTYVVDLGSSNGTFMGTDQLPRHCPRPWGEDQIVKFSGLQDGDTARVVPRSALAACRGVKRPREEVGSRLSGSLVYGGSASSNGEATKLPRLAGATSVQPRNGCFSASNTSMASAGSASSAPVLQLPRAKAGTHGITVLAAGAAAQSTQPGANRQFIGPQRPEALPVQGPQLPPGFKARLSSPSTGVRKEQCATNGSAGTGGGPAKCDKCDGPHLTDACPHFKKPREEHKDAWVNYGTKGPLQMGSDGGNYVLRHARAVRQPGDGSCLFHSLCFGLNRGNNGGKFAAEALRREIANFIEQNPRLEISGDTLEEWIRWDANASCSAYARRMASGGWGGGIEMAACSRLKHVSVHVYERLRSGEFKRISCFNHPSAKCTVHVLYQGGVHYDALVPSR